MFPGCAVTSVTGETRATVRGGNGEPTLVQVPQVRRGLGILGGTFDPPHVGHLAAAVEVRSALHLEAVVLMVANEPWQKVGRRSVSPAADRFAMTTVAVRGLDGVEASDLEIRRGGPTYSIDTLETLRATAPEQHLFLIVGADAVRELHTWHRHEELPRLATLVIVDRAGDDVAAAPSGWSIERVAMPRIDVTSSDLRDRAGRGDQLGPYVPSAVVDEIRNRRLYGLADS